MKTTVTFGILLAACTTTVADVIHVPSDQPTIQSAIGAATDGDSILIAPGTYREHLDPLGKAIEIRGDGTATEVILESPDGGTLLTVASQEPETTVFADLTFTGGVDDAAVRVEDASPTFVRCLFRDNLRTAAVDAGPCGQISGATFLDCLFLDNRAVNAGALYASHSNTTVDGCAFVGNQVSGQPSPYVSAGGAIYINNWDCGINVFTIRDCDFIENSAVWGAGIYAQGVFPSATTDLTISDCRFIANQASEGRSMWLWYIDSAISGTYVCGGGDQIHNGWGDAGGNVFADDCAGAEFDDCDGDRIPDGLAIAVGVAADCDGDGQPDSCTAGMPKIDADGNGIPDVCESLPCPADLSGNGVVDGGDLGIWLSLAGYDCQSDPDCPADVNGDGVSNGADLGAILAAWGECPN